MTGCYFIIKWINLLNSSETINVLYFIPGFIISVVVHEYGHYITHIYYNIPTELHINLFKGRTESKVAVDIDRIEHMNISIMGPLFNYIFGLFFLTVSLFYTSESVVIEGIFWIGIINIGIGIENILNPIPGSDGRKLIENFVKIIKVEKI